MAEILHEVRKFHGNKDECEASMLASAHAGITSRNLSLELWARQDFSNVNEVAASAANEGRENVSQRNQAERSSLDSLLGPNSARCGGSELNGT
jgi:hypothetical protein